MRAKELFPLESEFITPESLDVETWESKLTRIVHEMQRCKSALVYRKLEAGAAALAARLIAALESSVNELEQIVCRGMPSVQHSRATFAVRIGDQLDELCGLCTQLTCTVFPSFQPTTQRPFDSQATEIPSRARLHLA